MTKIIQREISINDQKLIFFHPNGDDTIYGTLACLNKDAFHLNGFNFAPDDVFVDLGCNIGLLSLIIAKLNPRVRVLAFDASALAIECLRKAIAANNLTNLQAFHAAVGSEAAKSVCFYSNGKDASCLVEEGLNSSNRVRDNSVGKIKIDDIFDSPLFAVDRVKYLKMDIEGGEHSIFAHLFAERTDILDHIDYLHLEVHPKEGPESNPLIEKIVAKFGSRVFFDT